MAGTHRRLLASDVLAYRQRRVTSPWRRSCAPMLTVIADAGLTGKLPVPGSPGTGNQLDQAGFNVATAGDVMQLVSVGPPAKKSAATPR